MSRVHLSDNILLVSDMGKIASKMLPTLTSIRPQQQRQQHQPQGEVVKMDVEDIINNKHGLTEDEDCILEHDNKKMKLMVDGESFVKVGVRKALRHNKKQLTQQISLVFTEGQEDEVVHKHKQPSHQVNEAKPELFASEESARGGDVQCADACAVSLEGDSECGPVPELPIEILNSVFEYVRLQDRCAASMTCRSWHVAAWQCVSTMEFNMRHRPEQDTIIASILRRCPNIRHVTLRDCFSVTGRLLRCLPMTVQSFQFFNCPNFVKTLQNDDIKYLSRDMLSLSLGNCENISDDGVSSLPSSLKHLEMCGSKISEAGISSLPRTLKSLVLKRSQVAITSLSALPATLVSLDVSNCHLEANALLALPKSLVTLSLVGCVTVTDQHLEQLSTCSELQTLLLDGCDRVTFKGIEALPQSMKSLSIKNCAGVNDRALSALPRGIRDLTIWKCKNVTKLAFSRLPSTLVSLKLVHTAVADECIGMLPNTLKRLSLFGCSQITDAAMQVLPPLVSDLDLSWTPVTDSGICHLTRLTKLTKVNLSNTKVSREGIIVLENTVPALTVLKGYCD